MTFNLRAAVMAVLDTTSLSDPRDIASKVAENIPPRDRLAALTESLDPFVREAIQRTRRSNPLVGPRPATVRPLPNPAPSVRSAKREAIFAAALRSRIHVGESHWKMLGECTFADLMSAAAERREHAEQNAAAAERYERLANLLRRHGADTVSALPAAVLSEAVAG